jgi:hypothetical protein
MSSNQSQKITAADLLVIALSPILVMGLVGSLAFFLVEVFYGGQYDWELRYILFFWVFGAVLIARMSLMGEIAGRTSIYGGVLGVLVWIGSMRFMTYPPGSPAEPFCWLINGFLVAIIFWSAWKVTRDCTDISDDDGPASGEGLLQAAGLEALDPRPVDLEPEAKTSVDTAEKPAKKRTPGIWIVYFSLAALPLFGLGEVWLPTQKEETRERAFWMLAAYTACGLGLLLTTCFLGLRRYLRQRKLRMPAAMAGTWLAVGGGVIGALLLLAGLLPRPWAETGPFRYQPAVSEERDASDQAQIDGDAGKGEGRGDGHQQDTEAGGKQGGENSREGRDGQAGDGQNNSQSGGNAGGKQGRAAGGRDKSGGRSRGNGRAGQDNSGQQANGGEQNAGESSSSSSFGEIAKTLGSVLKWIVFALIAVVVVVFLLRNGLRYFAQFSQWARDLLNSLQNLWARLFGGGRESAENQDVAAEKSRRRIKSFAEYPDPFADGSAERMKATALIRYAFEALQAWAVERDLARRLDETPTEFARRLGDEIPAIDAMARQLAALYTRAAYAPGTLPPAAVEPLRNLWRRLEQVAAAPMSAGGID